MNFSEKYKKKERENIDKEVDKLKKETTSKTERELLLEILHRVKLIGYSIAGLALFFYLFYLFGGFR